MSSPEVRQAVKDGWVTLFPDVFFADTNNTTPDPTMLPPMWVTMLFEGSRDGITLGAPACYRELGTIAVVIMTKAGTNDAQSGQLADRIFDEFVGFVGANGYLEIVNVQPPNDGANEVPQKSEYYKTIVEMDYRFDKFA